MILNFLKNMEIEKRLRIWSVLFSISLASLYTWHSKHLMSADGMSYTDMAHEALKGNISELINPIWSPLYPLLISIVLTLTNSTNYWEFSIIHFLNLLIFLFCLVSFDFFLSQAIKAVEKTQDSNYVSIPRWALIVIGYSIFSYESINVITLWIPTPDLLVSGLVYILYGFLLKQAFEKQNFFLAIGFGFILGLSYYAKAAMFPIGFIFITSLFFYSLNKKFIIQNVLTSFIVFLLISFPLIYFQSKNQHYLTFGESSKLNYAWYINDVPLFVHWQGEGKNKGTPIHPTRKINTFPPVYEFEKPIKGTYSPWYNPFYWYEGANTRFNFFRQIAVICSSIQTYCEIFFKETSSIVFGIILLFCLSNRNKEILRDLAKNKIIFFPAIFSLVMFSLIHIEARYIGGFLTAIFIGLLVSIKYNNTEENKKTVGVLSFCIFLFFTLINVTLVYKDINSLIKKAPKHTEWIISETLKINGLNEGDKVGVIGYEMPYLPYWAQVGKYKIVCEILKKDAPDFYFIKDEKEIERILKLFKSHGVKVIVADKFPKTFSKYKWKKIEKTDTYFLFL